VKRLMRSGRQLGSASRKPKRGHVLPGIAEPAGRRIVDLTHTLTPEFPTYDGPPGIAMRKLLALDRDGCNVYDLVLNEHSGTHLDAPLHFSNGLAVDAIPVKDLVVPLAVIDIRAKASEDPDSAVTPDDLDRWIAAFGEFPLRCCVAMWSGWEVHLGTERFLGKDGDGRMHFPGFHPEAVQQLLENTSAVGIAVDTLSLDPGFSEHFEAHSLWLPAGRWGLEAVANLGEVPASGALLIVGAPKHSGGTGGPARVLALV
jgi:kynurenine formamidase